MPIEKMLYASESAAEEAELELQSLLEEFKEWWSCRTLWRFN